MNFGSVSFDYSTLLSTPKELTGKYIKCLLYGPAGSGKTTLMGTFPKTLVLDTNKGLKTLENSESVRVISLEQKAYLPNGAEVNANVYKTVMQILNEAKYRKGLFAEGGVLADVETIAIDDMTNLVEFLKYGILKFVQSKDPAKEKADFDTWGMLGNQINDIVSTLKSIPYNVVVTAGEKIEMDELRGGQVGGVLIQGSHRHTLPHEFDEVYHLSVKSAMGKATYVADVVPVYPFTSKSRLGFKAQLVNPTYETLSSFVKK